VAAKIRQISRSFEEHKANKLKRRILKVKTLAMMKRGGLLKWRPDSTIISRQLQ
jgi:hypothetical protein